MLQKSTFKIELLKEDYSSVFVDLKEELTIFEENRIKCKITENNGKYGVFAEVFLAKGYIGYSFVYDFYFDDFLNDSLFFVPSAHYGKIDSPSKLCFAKNRSGIGVDGLSAPLVSFYDKGIGYVLKDLTPGHRDTISADASIEKSTKILISNKFDLPGLGIFGKDNKIILQYRYPAHTYNSIEEDCDLYRYSSARKVRFFFVLFNKQEKSFDEFYINLWRDEFSKRECIKNGIDTNEALKALLEYTCRGYGVRNGIPQFCTNTDHYTNESGFLYRNADLAELLLRFKYAGYDVNLSFKQIIDVLDSQVDNEYAGKNQVWEFSRSRFEGVYAVLLAYLLLKEHGVEKDRWWSFVLKEADFSLDNNDYFSVPLLACLYELTNNQKYLEAAKNKCEVLWEKKVSINRFFGGIVDFVGAISLDKETGICALSAFLRLYEITKDPKYLVYAKKAADYAETYTQLQQINLEPKEYDDTDDYCHLGHGNSHVNTQGLSYVSATCAIADLANMFGLFDYVKLYEYTGDSHYLEFANYVYTNSYNFANLDDKTGGMDDYLYNSGFGFTPEYIALAASIDRVCRGRGRMHDSTLAWVLYGFLSVGYCFENSEKYKPNNKLDERYKIIKVEAIETYQSELPAINLITGGRTTFFDVANNSRVVLNFKPNTHIDKIVIAYHDSNVCCSYLIENISSRLIRHETHRYHNKNYYDVIDINDDVTKLTITFKTQEEFYLCGIIPFGITNNEFNKYNGYDSETFVSRWIKNDISYYNGDKLIEFNYRTNTYVDDQIEFLRGGLLRAKDRCGHLKLMLNKPSTVFWFRKSLIEPCEGNVKVSVLLNNKLLMLGDAQDKTTYLKVNGTGEIEMVFDSKKQNSIEFGYLEIKKEDQ